MIWRLRGCYSGAHNKKIAMSIYLSLLCYNLIKIYMEITAIMRYRRVIIIMRLPRSRLRFAYVRMTNE